MLKQVTKNMQSQGTDHGHDDAGQNESSGQGGDAEEQPFLHAVAAELEMLRKAKSVFDEMTAVNCTGCEYCMPCPFGVNIPECFTAFNSTVYKGKRSAKEHFIVRVGKIFF